MGIFVPQQNRYGIDKVKKLLVYTLIVYGVNTICTTNKDKLIIQWIDYYVN